MKTLHKYLLGQVFASLLLTVGVFTAVLLVGNALREILTLLASAQVSLLLVAKAILYLIPFVWVFALPMGMLTATLLVFGRFSADQELTAARASGVSLVSLISPVLGLSLVCCGLSAWFNMDLGPRCRAAYKDILSEAKSGLVNARIPEGRFIRDFPGYIFYVEKNTGDEMRNIMIYKLQNDTNVIATIRAERGRLKPGADPDRFIVDLFEARTITASRSSASIILSSPAISLDLSPVGRTNAVSKPKISDMTFVQLREELRSLETLRPATPSGPGEAPDPRAQLAALRSQQKELLEPVRVAMHREVAFSFACFGFTLVGIPLGIRVHRRETNIGIAIALVLVVLYYAFIMFGASLSDHPGFYPHLILWIPNFLFQAIGAVLLWRANRGI